MACPDKDMNALQYFSLGLRFLFVLMMLPFFSAYSLFYTTTISICALAEVEILIPPRTYAKHAPPLYQIHISNNESRATLRGSLFFYGCGLPAGGVGSVSSRMPLRRRTSATVFSKPRPCGR